MTTEEGTDPADKPRSRKYEKKARAAQEAQTRARIVAAVGSLVEEGGAASVNVSAVARRAGVQRLTVYRHFPGGRGMVEACTAERSERQPPPAPAGWPVYEDPARRLRRALRDLYAWYRASHPFLEGLGQDGTETAAAAARAHAVRLEGVVAALAPDWKPRGGRARELRAGLEHAVRFETWRSLCHESGLGDRRAARLMTRLIRTVARKQRRGPTAAKETA